jgi:hypothetical protein
MARRDWRQPTISLSQVTTVIRAMAIIGPSIDELDFSGDGNTVARDLFPSEGALFETAKTVFSNLTSFGIAFHDSGMAGQQPLGDGFLKLFRSAKNLQRIFLGGGNMTPTTLPNMIDELAILFPSGDPNGLTKAVFSFPQLKALDLL